MLHEKNLSPSAPQEDIWDVTECDQRLRPKKSSSGSVPEDAVDVTECDEALRRKNAAAAGTSSADASGLADVTECDPALPCASPTVPTDPQPSGLTPIDPEARFPVPFAETLSQRQQTAIGLLLAGERDTAVAEKAGVHRMTLWRWKQNPYFREALSAARELAFGSAIDRLQDLAPRAVDILEIQLQAGDLKAALQVLRLIRVDRAGR